MLGRPTPVPAAKFHSQSRRLRVRLLGDGPSISRRSSRDEEEGERGRQDSSRAGAELSLLPPDERGHPPTAASPPPSATLPPAPPGAGFVGRPVPPRRAVGPRPRGRSRGAGGSEVGAGRVAVLGWGRGQSWVIHRGGFFFRAQGRERFCDSALFFLSAPPPPPFFFPAYFGVLWLSAHSWCPARDSLATGCSHLPAKRGTASRWDRRGEDSCLHGILPSVNVGCTSWGRRKLHLF